MSSYLMIGIPILILLLMIAYIALYNRLNRLRVKVEEAGADIDVALEKRFDLLSEEIEAVKKYLSHEYQIMTDLTAARVSIETQELRMGYCSARPLIPAPTLDRSRWTPVRAPTFWPRATTSRRPGGYTIPTCLCITRRWPLSPGPSWPLSATWRRRPSMKWRSASATSR